MGADAIVRNLLAALLFILAGSAHAQSAEDDFVEANILSVFYHELGHALIDVMQLPVFGQEEDAADTASVLLIDMIFREEAAQGIAKDAALGFAAEAELSEGYETAWWSQHGADLQRFYNLVCLFYGADPDLRDDFAEDMGLPEGRAETCPEEFELANESWGPVFDELIDGEYTGKFYFNGANDSFLADILMVEVEDLNERMGLPTSIEVVVETCGEANGFYDLEKQQIIICQEFEPYLRELARVSR